MKYIPGINLTTAHLPDWPTRILHVDVNRTDTYTAAGTELKPYKTLSQALEQVNILFGEGEKSLSVKIAPGTYDEDIVYSIPDTGYSLYITGSGKDITYIKSLDLSNTVDTEDPQAGSNSITIQDCTIGLSETDRTSEVLKITRRSSDDDDPPIVRMYVYFNSVKVIDKSNRRAIYFWNDRTDAYPDRLLVRFNNFSEIHSTSSHTSAEPFFTIQQTMVRVLNSAIFNGKYSNDTSPMINLVCVGSLYVFDSMLRILDNMIWVDGGELVNWMPPPAMTVPIAAPYLYIHNCLGRFWLESNPFIRVLESHNANDGVIDVDSLNVESFASEATAVPLIAMDDTTTTVTMTYGSVNYDKDVDILSRIEIPDNKILKFNRATGIKFVPTTAVNWPEVPNDVQGGLDGLALRSKLIENKIGIIGQSLYVDKDSVQTLENGTFQYPYKTIAAALSAAETKLVTENSVTIVIADGKYDERLTFTYPASSDKKYLTIIGSGIQKSVETYSLKVDASNMTASAYLYLDKLYCNMSTKSTEQAALHLKSHDTILNAWASAIKATAGDGTNVPSLKVEGTGSYRPDFITDSSCEFTHGSVTVDTPTILCDQGRLRLTGGYIHCSSGLNRMIEVKNAGRCYVEGTKVDFASGSASNPPFVVSSGINCQLTFTGTTELEVENTTVSLFELKEGNTNGHPTLLLGNVFIEYEGSVGDPVITGEVGAVYTPEALIGGIHTSNGTPVKGSNVVFKDWDVNESETTLYTPDVSGNWDAVPDNVRDALNELASRVNTLETP